MYFGLHLHQMSSDGLNLNVVRDRSLFIPQGGTEEKLKKVYIKK